MLAVVLLAWGQGTQEHLKLGKQPGLITLAFQGSFNPASRLAPPVAVGRTRPSPPWGLKILPSTALAIAHVLPGRMRWHAFRRVMAAS